VAALAFGALTLARNRDYETREALWESSLAAWPGNARGWTNLGLAVIERDPAAAERHFRHALEIAPDWVPALIHLGDVLRLQGRLEEAQPPLERALALEPDYAKALNSYGTVLATQGRLDEAVAHFERAIEVEPTSRAAHVNLGYARVLLGDPEGAIPAYQRALALAPSAETHFKLADALLRLGREDEATAHLREAARRKPLWEAPLLRLRRLATP
jgi:tetratricopeptide (TPR) repeat protein